MLGAIRAMVVERLRERGLNDLGNAGIVAIPPLGSAFIYFQEECAVLRRACYPSLTSYESTFSYYNPAFPDNLLDAAVGLKAKT